MSVNVSKQKRQDLTAKIKAIHNYIAAAKPDANTRNLLTWLSEVEKELNAKKFGLVFEEHREAIDETLETHTPVLTENKKLFVDNGGQVNFLIEGDNLAALKLLEKTHKGKVDVIYIDPPYNLGNKDFIYDDCYVDKDDSYRHSKWLSFMHKRLMISRQLLNQNGLIFIHIDDTEFLSLKVLCDSVFGENSFVNCIAVKLSEATGVKMNHVNKRLPKVKEYILLYKKKKVYLKNIQIPKQSWDNEYRIWLNNVSEDDIRFIKEIREDSERSASQIEEVDAILSKIEYVSVNDVLVQNNITKDEDILNYKINNSWRIVRTVAVTGGAKTIADKKQNTTKSPSYCIITPQKEMYFIMGGYNTLTSNPRIKLLFADDYLTVNPCDFWQDIKTTGLDNEGYVDFRNGKKPLKVAERVLELANNNNAVVLDFFAGSGTAGHAVLTSNKKDQGKRKFILCTNNENNICKEKTYTRIKETIKKESHESSLKYYKIDYIPISDKLYYEYADDLLAHIRELVELENAINFIENDKIAIVLTDNELSDFVKNIKKHKNCRKLYKAHDVLVSVKQREALKGAKVRVIVIPDYYYRELGA
jgi:adenine-specific DNA-methyltransferase